MILGRWRDKYMCLFKRLILILLLLSPLRAFAGDDDLDDEIVPEVVAKPAPPPPRFRTVEFTTLSFSYVSWKEQVTLSGPTGTDSAYANFYGNSFGYEHETYLKPTNGTLYGFDFMFGRASVGGSQVNVPYQEGSVGWLGIDFSYRYVHRLTNQIAMSVGPLLLARQAKLPADDVDVSSGSQYNIGAIADLRLRLSKPLEIHQMIGTLYMKASTIWSFGLGYKF